MSTHYKFDNKRKILKTKTYTARDSILPELLESPNGRATYSILWMVIITFALTTIVHDAIYKQEFNIGLGLIVYGFTNVHKLWVILVCMFGTSLLPYYGLKCWISIKNWLKDKGDLMTLLWNVFSIIAFLAYISCTLYYYTEVAVTWNIGECVRLIVLTENVRYSMKAYAFVRSNVGKYLNGAEKKNMVKFNVSLKHYIYFLFAPVLVYEDSYPRSDGRIQWILVISNLQNVVLGVFCLSLTLQRTYIAEFSDYDLRMCTWKEIVLIILRNAPSGFLISAIIFYILIHSWFNAFGEILQFSDRQFYADWWTSTGDAEIMRKWNIVVYDWLYEYIYKEVAEIANRYVAQAAVIIISAIFHDYVLNLTLGIQLPLFFSQYLLFFLTVPIQFKNKTTGSIFVLTRISITASVVIAGATMEYYAVKNCPVPKNNTQFYMPRFIAC